MRDTAATTKGRSADRRETFFAYPARCCVLGAASTREVQRTEVLGEKCFCAIVRSCQDGAHRERRGTSRRQCSF
jgi:hypothetical protein